MSITLDAVILPDDLVWVDEFDWTPVKQSEEFTLTGAQIIDSGIKQVGRPIVMQGGANAAWIERANLKTLFSKLDDNAEMTLTLGDARSFNVRFDHKSMPIVAKPISDYANPEDQDDYTLTVRFITV